MGKPPCCCCSDDESESESCSSGSASQCDEEDYESETESCDDRKPAKPKPCCIPCMPCCCIPCCPQPESKSSKSKRSRKDDDCGHKKKSGGGKCADKEKLKKLCKVLKSNLCDLMEQQETLAKKMKCMQKRTKEFCC